MVCVRCVVCVCFHGISLLIFHDCVVASDLHLFATVQHHFYCQSKAVLDRFDRSTGQGQTQVGGDGISRTIGQC